MEVKLADVSVVYTRAGEPPRKALNKISFSLKTGEAVALLGPIGSGKSTLLQVIAGLRPPTSGQISVRGQDGPIVLSIQEPHRGFLPLRSGKRWLLARKTWTWIRPRPPRGWSGR